MSSSESSGISKLTINAYADNKFSASKGEYIVDINPESVKITSSVDYHLSQGMGAPGTLRYNSSAPRVLSFKLLFDNSGIIPETAMPVEDNLQQLAKVTRDVQTDIQSPYYVRVTWGVIDFKGRLINLDVRYTKWSAEGKPVRAEAFVQVLEEVGLSKTSQKAQSSAAGAEEMSSQQLQEGESLPSAAEEALGDPELAPELGELNGLDGLRMPELPGFNLDLSFDLWALLMALLAKLLEYLKEGAEWLIQKGSEAYAAGKGAVNEAKANAAERRRKRQERRKKSSSGSSKSQKSSQSSKKKKSTSKKKSTGVVGAYEEGKEGAYKEEHAREEREYREQVEEARKKREKEEKERREQRERERRAEKRREKKAERERRREKKKVERERKEREKERKKAGNERRKEERRAHKEREREQRRNRKKEQQRQRQERKRQRQEKAERIKKNFRRTFGIQEEDPQ